MASPFTKRFLPELPGYLIHWPLKRGTNFRRKPQEHGLYSKASLYYKTGSSFDTDLWGRHSKILYIMNVYYNTEAGAKQENALWHSLVVLS